MARPRSRSGATGWAAPADFERKEQIQLPSAERKVIFQVYAPQVFREIRRSFGVDDESFKSSLGIKQVLGSLIMGDLTGLSELVSEGKSGASASRTRPGPGALGRALTASRDRWSPDARIGCAPGSFFYFSSDNRFLVKTISSAESRTLQRILPNYLAHLHKHHNTLLSRIFGLYKLKMDDTVSVFVIMGNVFNPTVPIHQRYDLKVRRWRWAWVSVPPKLASILGSGFAKPEPSWGLQAV